LRQADAASFVAVEVAMVQASEGGVFKLPRVALGAGSVELRASELAMLLDGIDMAKLKRAPRYERPLPSRLKDNENAVAYNAGIQKPESLKSHPFDLTAVDAIIAINLRGSIH